MNTQLDLFQESYVKGVFKQEIFYNEETGYGVFILKVTDASEEVEEEEITVVGNMLRPYQEEVYCCYGEWRNHPKFGRQWYAHRVQKEIPRSRDAIIRYLSSGLFSGVGQRRQKKSLIFGDGGARQNCKRSPLFGGNQRDFGRKSPENR